MTAADIARALGDARREGRTWRCRCPLHGGRSLTLRDGDGGAVLPWCFGGWGRRRGRAGPLPPGLPARRPPCFPRAPPRPSPPRQAPRSEVGRTARALAIWNEARPGVETIVESYLRNRGIVFDASPPALRFHPACPRPRGEAGNFRPQLPAMLALVEHVQRGPVAVHATYLRRDGSGKADIPKDQQKASVGPLKGAAGRLRPPPAAE